MARAAKHELVPKLKGSSQLNEGRHTVETWEWFGSFHMRMKLLGKLQK